MARSGRAPGPRGEGAAAWSTGTRARRSRSGSQARPSDSRQGRDPQDQGARDPRGHGGTVPADLGSRAPSDRGILAAFVVDRPASRHRLNRTGGARAHGGKRGARAPDAAPGRATRRGPGAAPRAGPRGAAPRARRSPLPVVAWSSAPPFPSVTAGYTRCSSSGSMLQLPCTSFAA